jgi:hypothetical protein
MQIFSKTCLKIFSFALNAHTHVSFTKVVIKYSLQFNWNIGENGENIHFTSPKLLLKAWEGKHFGRTFSNSSMISLMWNSVKKWVRIFLRGFFIWELEFCEYFIFFVIKVRISNLVHIEPFLPIENIFKFWKEFEFFIWRFEIQIMMKEWLRLKLTIRFSTIKIQETINKLPLNWACNMVLESSFKGIWLFLWNIFNGAYLQELWTH